MGGGGCGPAVLLAGNRASWRHSRRRRRARLARARPCCSMQSRSEEAAAGLQSELELAMSEMDRSQQRLATLEQEKAGLLQRLAASSGADGAAAGGQGGDAGIGGTADEAGGSGSRAAEESLRQELHAQVGAGWAAARAARACCVLPCQHRRLLRRSAALQPPVHFPPALPPCPVVSLLQRELATRLQSEVSALRQQLEAGERGGDTDAALLLLFLPLPLELRQC